MDLRSRGGKGKRSFMDTLFFMCICLLGMRFRPGFAEEYSHYVQNTDTGFIGDTADSISSEQDTDNKRSSSFFPLRGKKPSLDTSEIPFRYPLVSSQQLEDKRSQFYPLRGKKIPTELKRASYFMPMRGRKDDQEWSEEDSPEKRMSSFMPMRGRKDGEDTPNADSLGKRMSSFMPMRGRKDDENSLGKRMSSFMPMRGRKDDDESTEEDSLEKRMSSFMPMRGRKDDEDSLEKRMSSFMPMRGKKKSSQLMDTYIHLGKSGTYTKEILKSPSSSSSNKGQSAFIPEPENNPLQNYIKPISSTKNVPRITEPYTEKRSLSFMPMRGKRSLSEDQNEYLGRGEIVMSLVDKKRPSFMPMRGRREASGGSNKSFLFNLGDHGIEGKSVTLSMKESNKSQANPETQTFKDFEQTPSIFVPTRERRSTFQGDFDYEITSKDKRRRRSQFMPMRGRREYEENNVPNYNYLLERSFTEDQSKRAPSFMAMRGRRSKEDLKRTSPSVVAFKHPSFIPIWVSSYGFTQNENSMDSFSDNQTEESLTDRDDKRASYFMPMRGRRAADYFYQPYPYHLPSGIGSSLMTRYFGGKMYPVSPTWSAATKSRKFDWDSVKRAFHATRGKRSSLGGGLTNIYEKTSNFGQRSSVVPDQDNQGNAEGTGASQDIEDELKELQNWAARETSSSEQDSEILGKGCRCKRSILRPRISVKNQRQYIALKRPMSFFATRGKRMDDSASAVSKIPLE